MPPKTVVVIGAGIAGCSSAYALAQRGIKVSLIERHERIAMEASGNPQAMLYPRLSGDDSASQFALAGYLYSLKLIKELQLQAEDFHACGMLQLGFNDRELARLEKVLSWKEAGQQVQLLNPTQASQQAGITLVHPALYFANAAWLKPTALCRALITHPNISVKTSTKPNKILKNNGLFKIYADQLCLEKADAVILANANQAQELGIELYLKTLSVRGQLSMVKTSEVSSALRNIICSDGYLSPADYGVHSLGASFSSEQSVAIDEYDHLANLNKLNSCSAALYGSLKDKVVGGRVSFRCTSADYFPLLGELLDHAAIKTQPPRPNANPSSLPWSNGLYVNLAHGSRGFTSAPYCAEILAGLICQETLAINPSLLNLLNPNRFLLRKLGLKKLARSLPAAGTTGIKPSLG